MNQKEISKAFLMMCVTQDVDKAYDMYIHKDFTHHNQYFKKDRKSLLDAMIQNNIDFPHKKVDVQFQIEENDMVTNYSIIQINEETVYRVVHIFRFHHFKIIEAWDIGEKVL
mgnify:CR=1 FL=1